MIGAILGSIGLPALAKAGTLGASMAAMSPALLGALGSGLGTFLQTKDPRQALAAGIGGYGASKAFGSLTSGGGAFGSNVAKDVATTATTNLNNATNFNNPIAASEGVIPNIATPTFGQSLIDTATNPAVLASIAGSALAPPPPPMDNMDVDEIPPEGMAPAPMTNRPPEGYRPGVDPEFDYKFPLNYYGGGIMKYQQGGLSMQDFTPAVTEEMIGDFPYVLRSDVDFDKEAMMAKVREADNIEEREIEKLMNEDTNVPLPESRPSYLMSIRKRNIDLPEPRPQPTTFSKEFKNINEKYLNPIFPTPSMGVEALLEMLSKNKKLKEAKAALPKENNEGSGSLASFLFPKQEGGMLPDEQMIQEDIMAESVPPEGMPNDKDIINDAVQAIKGESQNPEIALGAFLQMFGEEALRDLVARADLNPPAQNKTISLFGSNFPFLK